MLRINPIFAFVKGVKKPVAIPTSLPEQLIKMAQNSCLHLLVTKDNLPTFRSEKRYPLLTIPDSCNHMEITGIPIAELQPFQLRPLSPISLLFVEEFI